MKLYILLITLMTLTACKKTTDEPIQSPTTTNNPGNVRDSLSGNAIQAGVFMNGVHTTKGKVAWIRTNGKDTLSLTDFMTDAGPDLKVYLSTDNRASSFVNLGDLKSFNGNQYYTIPAGREPSDYKFVLIWCQRFSVLFGSAELK